MALLLLRNRGARIALAAPTGKAAARLAETVAGLADELPLDQSVRDRIPREAKTVHRLLAYSPDEDRFRQNAERPLAVDAVVVDEASMVDLLMMQAILEALPRNTRVILLGDSGQLASVGTGNVLGDVCRAAGEGAQSAAFAAAYHRLSGSSLASADRAGPLQDAVVELRKNWRFKDQPGIAALASAIRAGRDEEALAVLTDPQYPDASLVAPGPAEAGASPLAPVLPHLRSVCGANSAQEALERLAAVRILCALRRGKQGAGGFNARVESSLRRKGFLHEGENYHARPIMVTINDYGVRLFNGDVGILWRDPDGIWANFMGPDDELRRIPVAKLPAHETAWAMTVHKSQGSEFRHVLLVLPEQESAVLNRELLYTGVTRARETVHVIGEENLIRTTVKARAQRGSGLEAALAGGTDIAN